jgi:serine/threonine protein phosphatase PrpC
VRFDNQSRQNVKGFTHNVGANNTPFNKDYQKKAFVLPGSGLNSSGSINEKFSKQSIGSQPFSMGKFKVSGFLSPKNNSVQTDRMMGDNFSLGSQDYVKLNFAKNKRSTNRHFLDSNPYQTQKSEYMQTAKNVSVQMKFVNVPGLENGREKITQDSVLINKFKIQNEVFFVFAVFDGHGRHGHFISQYTKKNTIPAIKYFLKKQFASGKIKIKDVLRHACQYLNMKIQKISEKYTKKSGGTFNILHSNVSNDPSISQFDASLSGTTCSLVLLYKQKIYSLSLGDSKGVLGVLNPNQPASRLMPYLISTEHKASSKSEQNRILSSGGFLHPIINKEGEEVGPIRIWDSSNKYPGLMVSRSFGDLVGKSCGVSGEPDILEVDLKTGHRCLLLATDGFWDMHSDLEALSGFYSVEKKGLRGIEQMLVEKTKQTLGKWEKNFKKTHRDDISIILVYFDYH